MYKLIKTEQDHEQALERIDELAFAEQLTSEQADELELLVHLAEEYEERECPIGLPSPVEAIKFRMEQLGLNQADMTRYIGSKSNVSEVLSGKRSLSLSMMRKLHAGLGIPAEVLLQDPDAQFPTSYGELEWEKFPLKELAKRNIIPAFINSKNQAEEAIRWLIQEAGSPKTLTACHRKGTWNGSDGDAYATLAWELIVRSKARQVHLPVKFDPENFTVDHLRRITHLSIYDDGPLKAKEYLAKRGIVLVTERPFKKTYLDGVALLLDDGTPVVGMTLRFDRLDYFWFTLLRELAHVIKHLGVGDTTCILDYETSIENLEARETEANEIAAESFIPSSIWESSEAKKTSNKKAVQFLARNLDIHEAIVAGRLRKERKNYHIHSQLLGNGKVNEMFF